MKEFDKWKDDNCIKHCNLCHIGVCGDCRGIGTKADAWRAALEWAKSNKGYEIADSICEELEG